MVLKGHTLKNIPLRGSGGLDRTFCTYVPAYDICMHIYSLVIGVISMHVTAIFKFCLIWPMATSANAVWL